MNKTLIEKFGRYLVYSVDGEALRKESLKDQEFSDWAIHGKGISQLEIIPKDEVWIDNNLNETDRKIAINSALYYYELERNNEGADNEKLYDKVVKLAKRELENLNKNYPVKKTDEEYNVKTSKGIKLQAGNTVFLVNGEKVREKYKTDFVLGGNSEVYKWIPRNEIWIERDVKPEERIFIVIHELVEWYEMKMGKMSYKNAHHQANLVEYRNRNQGEVSLKDLTVNWIRNELAENKK